jgi:hypothetical protein
VATVPVRSEPVRRATRDRLLRDLYLGLAIAFVLLRLFAVQPWDQSVDAYAYWSTRSGIDYGGATVGSMGSYLYSPAFAQLLAPITWLPWQIFVAGWTALNLAVLWWLAGCFALPLLLFLPIPFEIVSGNVHLLYAGVIVAGFRYPAAWLLPLITKVTPGIGLVWFGVRREWLALLTVGVVTAAVVAVSAVISPAAWSEWIRLLTSSANGPSSSPGWYLPVPLLPRAILAIVIVAIGALRSARWAVPVAVVVAMPVLWLNSLAVLAALLPIGLARRPASRLGREPWAVRVLRGDGR